MTTSDLRAKASDLSCHFVKINNKYVLAMSICFLST